MKNDRLDNTVTVVNESQKRSTAYFMWSKQVRKKTQRKNELLVNTVTVVNERKGRSVA
jgi:hypothetical protein